MLLCGLITLTLWRATGDLPFALVTISTLFAVTGAVVFRQSTVAATHILETALPSHLHAAPGVRGATRLHHTAMAASRVLSGVGHRTPRRHPLTGLDTREVLVERIGVWQGPALLGVIELSDFDALCAQNVESGEFLLKTFATRAKRMIADNRIIAQIDRARFAIWFEGGDSLDSAREFEALCYALGSRIEAPGLDFVPRIASWSTAIAAGVHAAPSLLAQALANLGRAESASPEATSHNHIEAQTRLTLEQDLRQAVTRHQFELHYQPFIDAERGKVCGAEALIRWDHPELGRIAPSEFVPLVENTGLAEEVGLWVLDTAISDAAAWQRDGVSGVRVAVNLSAHQLRRPELDTIVARMIDRHGLPGGMLELELTETVAALDCASACALFERLRARNISISIDDFGAGYSSLSYLKKLSFDKLKIDREFVTNVDSDRQSQAICQSIIALGRGLGITVLAEGVERHEEYVWLRRHGCRFFQGYYFSTPLDRAAFVVFAKRGSAVMAKASLGPGALLKKIKAGVA
jgi:EAL domain-containing protein (putative c-di-GMP-specific phosphodiesterase class I)/GGDEF domain-containing protein